MYMRFMEAATEDQYGTSNDIWDRIRKAMLAHIRGKLVTPQLRPDGPESL